MESVLNSNQLLDIEGTKQMLVDRAIAISTAIDTQVILQLLVKKGIATREEIQEMRNIVESNDEKYSSSKKWLEIALDELQYASEHPDYALKKAFQEKLRQ